MNRNGNLQVLHSPTARGAGPSWRSSDVIGRSRESSRVGEKHSASGR
jgi:hypothetical protein